MVTDSFFDSMSKKQAQISLSGALSGESVNDAKLLVKGLIKASKGILGQIGKPTPNFKGREAEVEAVMQSILKKRMRSCVLVGKAGVGKTEIVRQAIKRIGNHEIFVTLDVNSLQANCTLVGMIEERTNALFKPIAEFNREHKDVKISFFIDEVHTLFQVGRNEYCGTISVGDAIKPYLSDGSITIIGATTVEEYEKYIKKDKALLRRMPPIFIAPLNDEHLFNIVRGFCDKIISDRIIKLIIEQTARVKYLNNPDCALEIADRVMAKCWMFGIVPSDEDVIRIVDMMEGA